MLEEVVKGVVFRKHVEEAVSEKIRKTASMTLIKVPSLKSKIAVEDEYLA
jgi:hypothetical protein